jgi:hypothetical protein
LKIYVESGQVLSDVGTSDNYVREKESYDGMHYLLTKVGR